MFIDSVKLTLSSGHGGAGAGGTGIRCADGEDGTAGAWEHRAQIGAAGGYPCGKTGGKAAGGLSFAAPAG